MARTLISLDNGEGVWTAMSYSDVLNLLAGNKAAFVVFTNLGGHKEAVSPAHVVKVYKDQD